MNKAEEFIQENTRNCSQLHYNSACTLRHCITPDQAREAVEIAKQETIEKTKQLLKEKYLIKSIEPLRWVSWEKVFDDLKVSMKTSKDE